MAAAAETPPIAVTAGVRSGGASLPGRPGWPARQVEPSGARRFLPPAILGLLLAALLFCAMAAVQPRGLEGDAAQVDRAWARLKTLQSAPPVLPALPPPRERLLHPETVAPTAAARREALKPPAPVPLTPPRLARLTTPHALTPLDPLLQGLSPTPDAGGGGPVLTIDPNGTALGTAGDGGGGLLSGADPRALEGILGLGHDEAHPAPAANANRKPEWLQRIEPEYPPEALRRNQESAVVLRLRVSAQGRVLQAQILSATSTPIPGAEAAFGAAAAAAAVRSTFVPGTDEAGRAIEQWVKVSYLFQLR